MKERILLLGSDHIEFGKFAQETLGPASACLSPGSDPNSPAQQNKGDKSKPNEDALVVLRQGSSWLLAIADGHFGVTTSEALIEHLANIDRLPQRLGPLSIWLSSLQLPTPLAGSTLLVACYQETTRQVVGLSWGDSSVVSVSKDSFRLHNHHTANYLRGGSSIAIELAHAFEFTLPAGETLLLYSDGVNECCYRCPEYSVQPNHIQEAVAQSSNASEIAARVTELALSGVDGQVGGQDNVAVIALST